jgi:hypothetical protein
MKNRLMKYCYHDELYFNVLLIIFSMKNMGIAFADAETTIEDPNYGKWSKIYNDCTDSFSALEDGEYCYKDICIDVTAGVTYEIICINCELKCDNKGIDATCEPVDC